MRNEFEDSDEDQYGMLARIEDEYNYDFRTHLYVTGTLALVVNDPKLQRAMMNSNYQ